MSNTTGGFASTNYFSVIVFSYSFPCSFRQFEEFQEAYCTLMGFLFPYLLNVNQLMFVKTQTKVKDMHTDTFASSHLYT